MSRPDTMSGEAHAQIAHETLKWLRGPYQAAAAASDFPTLSGFERWLRVRELAGQIPHPIDPKELAALDKLDAALKAQLLVWLEHSSNPR
jgi:hypothetical protein